MAMCLLQMFHKVSVWWILWFGCLHLSKREDNVAAHKLLPLPKHTTENNYSQFSTSLSILISKAVRSSNLTVYGLRADTHNPITVYVFPPAAGVISACWFNYSCWGEIIETLITEAFLSLTYTHF